MLQCIWTQAFSAGEKAENDVPPFPFIIAFATLIANGQLVVSPASTLTPGLAYPHSVSARAAGATAMKETAAMAIPTFATATFIRSTSST
jgi:hypothetical protein